MQARNIEISSEKSRRSECRTNSNVQIGNKSFERVEYFKYLGDNPNELKFHSSRN